MNKIKAHFQKYIFYDIVGMIILLIMIILVLKFIHDYKEVEQSRYDFTNYEIAIQNAVRNGILKIDFDQNNISILKVDDLMRNNDCDKENCNMEIIPQTAIEFTDNQDQCVGYIIIEKLDNDDLKIDTSHVCDMIDY